MLACRVLPAAALVRARVRRVSAFNRLDLPTFDRPRNANRGSSSRSTPSRGPSVDALVTSYDKSSRKIGLSIKAREISEEKEAVAQYGSSDSGASLGDILGAALSKAQKGKKKKKADAEPEADEGDAEE